MKGSGNLYEYLLKQEALLKFRVFVLPQTLGCAITPIGHWVLWLARPVLGVQGHTGQHLDGGGVSSSSCPMLASLFIYLFIYLFLLFRAALVAYGGSQARVPIGAAAAGQSHNHSNARPELHLQPTPQLTATTDP